MARIRSIKPEFWDSPGVETLHPYWRLLYIAMWNWADDMGRGKAEARELMGFAFPRDEDMTLGEFRRGLGEVRRVFGVRFYKVGGRSFYAIPSWEKHQKIDKRSGARWPGPEEGEDYDPVANRPTSAETVQVEADSENLAEPSGEPAEDTPSPRRKPGAGTGEQGNRGTDIRPPVFDVTHDRAPERETGEDDAGGALVPLRSPRGGREVAERLNATAHSAGAHAIAREYAQHSGNPIPGKVLGDIAQRVDECLASGVPPEQIARGLIAWHESPITATSQIPSFVHKAAAKTARRGRSKPTDRALDATQIAEQMIREGLTHGN
ncbi:hypothetical protein [Nocardia gipuzkoensis]|uniref:hypothetical protein n=1 Tax=Nocardia gipuzkoensis TaxID=2749991 RepID=UPI0024574C67|nr:hypothetical protein [Nocardia gipuzkoensis]